jgi:uncharacterized protein
MNKKSTPGYILYVVLFLRPVLVLAGHLIATGIFFLRGVDNPFQTSGPYWSVYGTLADVGCLLALHYLLKRENARLVDLISFNREKLPRDFLLGILILVAGSIILIFFGGNIAALVAYGSLVPDFPEGSYIRYLPLWAIIYSRLIWWIIWSPTEELIYNGYLLPRLEIFTGNKWIALLLISFSWALMHCFLPFINLRHALYMFIMFFPLAFFFGYMYLKIRRLTPLILAHWMMDLSNVWLMTAVLGEN